MSENPDHAYSAYVDPMAIAGLIDGIDGMTAPEDIKLILGHLFAYVVDHHRDCQCIIDAERRAAMRFGMDLAAWVARP
jgi:hypothetical protein